MDDLLSSISFLQATRIRGHAVESRLASNAFLALYYLISTDVVVGELVTTPPSKEKRSQAKNNLFIRALGLVKSQLDEMNRHLRRAAYDREVKHVVSVYIETHHSINQDETASVGFGFREGPCLLVPQGEKGTSAFESSAKPFHQALMHRRQNSGALAGLL